MQIALQIECFQPAVYVVSSMAHVNVLAFIIAPHDMYAIEEDLLAGTVSPDPGMWVCQTINQPVSAVLQCARPRAQHRCTSTTKRV